jgi:hypothetical protein
MSISTWISFKLLSFFQSEFKIESALAITEEIIKDQFSLISSFIKISSVLYVVFNIFNTDCLFFSSGFLLKYFSIFKINISKAFLASFSAIFKISFLSFSFNLKLFLLSAKSILKFF